jgi:hypothetical protein
MNEEGNKVVMTCASYLPAPTIRYGSNNLTLGAYTIEITHNASHYLLNGWGYFLEGEEAVAHGIANVLIGISPSLPVRICLKGNGLKLRIENVMASHLFDPATDTHNPRSRSLKPLRPIKNHELWRHLALLLKTFNTDVHLQVIVDQDATFIRLRELAERYLDAKAPTEFTGNSGIIEEDDPPDISDNDLLPLSAI